MTKQIYYQPNEISWRKRGNPVLAAQEEERLSKIGVNQERGGRHLCRNCEMAWGQSVCMLGETYPGCVPKGRYVEKGDA